MPYSQFTTLASSLAAFGLTLQEQRFFPVLEPIVPSEILRGYLNETVPVTGTGSEKVRSEAIIYPVLIEIRRILNRQIVVFSGEDFTVVRLHFLLTFCGKVAKNCGKVPFSVEIFDETDNLHDS